MVGERTSRRGGGCNENEAAWTVNGHADLTFLLDFFKCTPPLEKPLGTHDQKEEMVMCTERITE